MQGVRIEREKKIDLQNVMKIFHFRVPLTRWYETSTNKEEKEERPGQAIRGGHFVLILRWCTHLVCAWHSVLMTTDFPPPVGPTIMVQCLVSIVSYSCTTLSTCPSTAFADKDDARDRTQAAVQQTWGLGPGAELCELDINPYRSAVLLAL